MEKINKMGTALSSSLMSSERFFSIARLYLKLWLMHCSVSTWEKASCSLLVLFQKTPFKNRALKPHVYAKLILRKELWTWNGIKTDSLTYSVLENWITMCNIKVGSISYIFKVNSKWIKDFTIQLEAIK